MFPLYKHPLKLHLSTTFNRLSVCLLRVGQVWCLCSHTTWWRHQMETFSALLAICAGNSPVPGEFPTQRPVTRSFDVYFDLRPNKRLSKQSWGWWFEPQSRPLWRHRNDVRWINFFSSSELWKRPPDDFWYIFLSFFTNFNVTEHFIIQIWHYIASKAHFILLWKRVKFTQRFSQLMIILLLFADFIHWR